MHGMRAAQMASTAKAILASAQMGSIFTTLHITTAALIMALVLRQKIYAIFKNAGTWEAYDAGAVDSLTTKGFHGNPIFDGQFMYFVPYNNGSASGIVLRYDTTKPFKSASSWEAYDAGATGGLTSKGFYWGCL